MIDDGGFVLFESLAITLYLAKKHSTGRLYPASLESEAKAWQWSLWAVTEVDRGVNIWSLHAVRLPPDERDAAKRAESERFAARDWRRAEEALTGAAATLEGGNLNRATRAVADALELYRESETKALAAKARAAR